MTTEAHPVTDEVARFFRYYRRLATFRTYADALAQELGWNSVLTVPDAEIAAFVALCNEERAAAFARVCAAAESTAGSGAARIVHTDRRMACPLGV